MKSELSSLELYFLLKEFQQLVGAKVEQIYQLERSEFTFQFHVPGKGKRILRIMRGSMMYLASAKGQTPQTPPGFCLFLRRKLKNARLRSVTQMGFERIVEILFETKDAKFRLVIEMFSKGNIILCDEQGTILSLLEQQEWKGRTLKPRQVYLPPERGVDLKELSLDAVREMLTKSEKESLVKSLAIDFGLGGLYAEELCLVAGVDKTLKPAQLSDREVEDVHSAIGALLSKDLAPGVVYSAGTGADEGEDSSSDVKDIVPFPLEFYKGLPFDKKADFNSALDSVFTTAKESREMEHAESAATTKVDKVQEIIRQQEQRIEGLERSAADNQRKGEFIYENYALVRQIIDEISAMREKMSWKEVEEKIRHNKIIKGVDEKTGDVTVEI
ncbi:NFACT family protein [Candidatus Woesearchaeota archaeon]|nr:NFACT family protein [Candidatus Woesearchaeota archaeon]